MFKHNLSLPPSWLNPAYVTAATREIVMLCSREAVTINLLTSNYEASHQTCLTSTLVFE